MEKGDADTITKGTTNTLTNLNIDSLNIIWNLYLTPPGPILALQIEWWYTYKSFLNDHY